MVYNPNSVPFNTIPKFIFSNKGWKFAWNHSFTKISISDFFFSFSTKTRDIKENNLKAAFRVGLLLRYMQKRFIVRNKLKLIIYIYKIRKERHHSVYCHFSSQINFIHHQLTSKMCQILHAFQKYF